MNIPPYLLNHHYNDRYFDVVDAISEAKQIFFDGNEIIKKLQTSVPTPKLIIGETGFGPGRTFIAIIEYLNSSKIKDASIIYNSVELHPLTSDQIRLIFQEFSKDADSLIEPFLEAYDTINISEHRWHQIRLNCHFGLITLNLRIGEALSMVSELDSPCDVWFLDGHSPSTNPAMWRPELLMAIGEKTRYLGSCATYTVAGRVRRSLISAGFSVEKVPGFGGKKEVLKAVKIKP